MAPARARRPRPPLDDKRLDELALRYVGRYATTRAKLRAYLARKLRERGWDGAREPDLDGLAEPFRRARLCRRRGLCAGQIAGAERRAATASGGWSRSCGWPASTRRTARAARDHADARSGRCGAALRRAAPDRPVRGAAAAIRGSARRRSAAMVRAGHAFRARAGDRVDWRRAAEVDAERACGSVAGLTLS